MAEVGRPTDLTDELVKKIKQSILDGNDLKTTANICEIDPQKLYNWNSDNYLNIGDRILNWKHERMLKLAEGNLSDIMSLGISDKDSLKVVADVSKFVSETLGKKNYSKSINTDITTKGKELPTPLLYGVFGDNSNKEGSESKQED